MIKDDFSKVNINHSFGNFLKKYDKTILKLFNVIKSFKKNIPNIYIYDKYNPPLRKNIKYTDKLFIV